MNDKEAIKFGIETLEYMRDCYPYMDDERKQALNLAIKALEEQPTGEWIPVSERLPEEEDYRPCYGLPDGCVMWQTDNGVIGFGWYYDSTKCWSDIYDHPIKAGKVIAWMTLPNPYRKGGKTNEIDN